MFVAAIPLLIVGALGIVLTCLGVEAETRAARWCSIAYLAAGACFLAVAWTVKSNG